MKATVDPQNVLVFQLCIIISPHHRQRASKAVIYAINLIHWSFTRISVDNFPADYGRSIKTLLQ